MPGANEQVFRVLNETARSIAHIDRAAIRAILPVLDHAHRELERDLLTWMRREGARSTFTAQRYRNAIMVVRRALQAGKRIAPTVERALKASTTGVIAPLALHNIEREWRAFSLIFEGTVQPLAIDEMAAIARGKSLLWPQFESSSRRYAGAVGERTQLELAIGHARGETIGELTNRMQQRFPEIFHNERWDAERLARTETMSAYDTVAEEGMREALDDDKELVQRWDATYDFRRCPMCASMDGQVVGIGEKFHAEWTTHTKKGPRKHSLWIEKSPAHPCCRCLRSIWRESWGKFSRKNSQPRPQALAA